MPSSTTTATGRAATLGTILQNLPPTPVDDLAMSSTPSAGTRMTPWKQLTSTVHEIIRDPLGTVVGMVQAPFHDLKTALFSITREELDNPYIQANIRRLGIDPTRLQPSATANEVLRAGGRTLALAAGTAAGAGVGTLMGPATGVASGAARGAVEAIAFGTVGGAITPVEEAQTRTGNMLTWSTLGLIPGVTLGGVTGLAAGARIRAQGVNPHLDAPETTPNPPEFDPRVTARHGSSVPLDETGTPLGTAAPRTALVPSPPRRVAPPSRPPTSGRRPPLAPADEIVRHLSIGERAKPVPLTFDGLYTALLDDLHPINQATKELLRMQRGVSHPGAPGVRLPGIDDPYVLARLARGSVAKGTRFLEQGALDWTSLAPVGPSLRDILTPIVQAGKVNELRAMLVAPRTLDLAARGIQTPIPVAAAKRMIETASPEVVQAGLHIFRYTDQLLQYVVDSGLISAEQAALWRQLNQHYVPMYRFMPGFVEQPGRPVSGSRRASVSPGIRRIKGGRLDLNVLDPLESIVRNTYALVSLADRHAVGEALVRLAETVPGQNIIRGAQVRPRPTGVAIDLQRRLREVGVVLPDDQAAEVASVLHPDGPEGTFWVMRNGRKQYYEVDAPLYRALLDLDRESSHILVRLLSYPTTIQKAGFTTFSPSFAVRNPLRDQFSAAVFSRYGFTPGYDALRGVFEVVGKGQMYDLFRRSGAEHATLVRSMGNERIATQRALDAVLRYADGPLARAFQMARSPRGWLEAIRRVSEITEESTRTMETARAMTATGDPRLAGFAGREATLDFSRMGWAARIANQIIPFLNPALQDLDKIARTFGAEGGRRAASAGARAAAAITMPTIALYLLNRDDPNYQELSNARKDFFWNIPLWRTNPETGNTERSGNFLALPKPFLLGMIFGTAPERALRWLDQQDPAAMENFAQNLLSSATPPSMPGAIGPAIEVATNHDFFRDGPIVPSNEQRLLPQEQAGPQQGDVVRLVARAFNTSPRNIEHLVTGYTGGLGTNALDVADKVLRLAGVRVAPPKSGPEDIPIVSRFVQSFLVREPTINSQSVRRFYTQWDEISAVVATVREVSKEGRGKDASDLATGYQAELMAYPIFQQTTQAMSELRAAINAVRAQSQLPMREREEKILLLGRTMRTLAADANAAYRNIQTAIENAQQPQRRPGVQILPTP